MSKNRLNFDRVVETAPDAMLGIDLAGVILFANRQAQLLFDYDSVDLLGQPMEILVPESVRSGHVVDRARYAADPEGVRMIGSARKVTGRRRDGTEFPVEVSLSLVDTEDGGLVTAAVRDITLRVTGERERDRLVAIIKDSGDAVVSVTLDGIVTSWNPAAERMFGFSGDEALGRDFLLLSIESSRDEFDAFVAKAGASQVSERFEATIVRKDGTSLSASIVFSPIRGVDGRTVGVSAVARDVTLEKQAFEISQHLAAVVEYSGLAIFGTGADGTVTSWNLAAEDLFGYDREAAVGTSINLLLTGSSAGEEATFLAELKLGRAVPGVEKTGRRQDGTAFPVSMTLSPLRDAVGAVAGSSVIARDLTEARRAIEAARRLAAAEELVRTTMASASIGIVLADLDGSFQVVNRSFCGLLGYDEAWLLAHRIRDIIHPDDVEEALLDHTRVIAGSTEKAVTTMRLVRANGATVWVRRVVVLLRDGDGAADMVMVQVEDITAEHDAQETLIYQAFHDSLTGLHNRAWILDILEVDLRAAKREGRSVGALFVDLDNFKVVNDSLGHVAGDEVLAIVADRIVASLRPGDRVGRFGGDEFIIVVQDAQDVLEVERCAERVSAAIAVDLQVRGHRIVPASSIGIATSTSLSTPESMLRDADSALFTAKAKGRAQWHFFDDAMHAQALARLTVEDEIREAITARQFVVYYQPIVVLADAHVVAHEALVRWAHPTRGLLSPGEFLDVAEHTGLIVAIGAQVLDQVCAMLAEHPDLPGPISVNVSAIQLARPDWLTSVRDTLATHRVDPSRIVIEVTETAVLSLVNSARAALTSLRELGIGIHLDDFGTGYSSISVLRDLPVTGVKLDLSFVLDLTENDSPANALAQGVNGLVTGMQLTGIAEGIETQMQADILRAQGWEYGQGYYFGKPATTPITH